MLLKTTRFLGRFYEMDGQLGWLPLHKAFYTMICGLPDNIKWVPQKDVHFDKYLINNRRKTY